MKRSSHLIFSVSLVVLCLGVSSTILSQPLNKRLSKTLPVSKSSDDGKTEFITVNQMKAAVSNTNTGLGDLSNMSVQFPSVAKYTPDNGIFWPGGKSSSVKVVSSDAFEISGYVDGKLKGLAMLRFREPVMVKPGRLLDSGEPDNPNQKRYRVFRIQKGWETLPFGTERDKLERNYIEWPVEDGAPWEDIDGDGIFSRGIDRPKFLGDEQIFYVCNDSDTSHYYRDKYYTYYNPANAFYFPKLEPIGIELQVTFYAKKEAGDLGDVIFRKYRVINKSSKTAKDVYISFFCDADAGEWNQNYFGTDTTLDLLYTYSKKNFDYFYNSVPPAAGYLLLQGPHVRSDPSDSAFFDDKWHKGYKNLRLSASSVFLNWYDQSHLGVGNYYPEDSSAYRYQLPSSFTTYFPKFAWDMPVSLDSAYRYSVMGKLWSGYPMINPVTGQQTRFALTGDPVKKTGWYNSPEGWPGVDTITYPDIDIHHRFSSGPFTLAPFDTQEVVIAVSAAFGKDNLNSITELKRKADAVRKAYFSGFDPVAPPETPIVHAVPESRSVTLWWENNSERYDMFDPLLKGIKMNDTLNIDSTYTFEGYIVRQYSDSLGRDPKIIAITDIKNETATVEDYAVVNGLNVKVPVIIAPNTGLIRYIRFDRDIYSGEPLRDGSEYYFSVTAYAYSKYSSRRYLESKPEIITVIPAKDKIDYSGKYSPGNDVLLKQTKGYGDGVVKLKIVDPHSIITGEYLARIIKIKNKPTMFTLVNRTVNDTIYNSAVITKGDSVDKEITRGFICMILDPGMDSIKKFDNTGREAIRGAGEIKGPGGNAFDEPVDVFYQPNSTGRWQVNVIGAQERKLSNINWTKSARRDDYEIRFTSQGSEYYLANSTGLAMFREHPKAKGRLPFEIWRISGDKKSEERLYVIVYDKDRDSLWSKDLSTGSSEAFYAYRDSSKIYQEPLAGMLPKTSSSYHTIGNITIKGDMPAEGTVIRISTFKPMADGDEFSVYLEKPSDNDIEKGRSNIDKITAFPNPYFAGNNPSGQEYVRFLGLPDNATIRIYNLAGIFVQKIEKTDHLQYSDWDLKTSEGRQAGSGIYLVHIDMPGIGSKVIKLAVIPEKEYLH